MSSARRARRREAKRSEIRDNVVTGTTTLKAGELEVTVPAPPPRAVGVDGSIHRVRCAVAAFYGADEAEPSPAELEARELELDAALRAWAQAGMPGA